ncbi:MAG: hypothetical protein WD942_05365 [Dehalococcoidia bacterium]
MASAKAATVIRGYLSLTVDERREVEDAIRRHQQGGQIRESVRKSFGTRLDTGPISGGCPCCGR